MKTFRAPWKGQLVLACGKCQRKLKRGNDEYGLSKLKKAFRVRRRESENRLGLLVINTPCLKICPKDGVAVCSRSQVGKGLCSVLRSGTDIDTFYELCVADERVLHGTLGS